MIQDSRRQPLQVLVVLLGLREGETVVARLLCELRRSWGADRYLRQNQNRGTRLHFASFCNPRLLGFMAGLGWRILKLSSWVLASIVFKCVSFGIRFPSPITTKPLQIANFSSRASRAKRLGRTVRRRETAVSGPKSVRPKIY